MLSFFYFCFLVLIVGWLFFEKGLLGTYIPRHPYLDLLWLELQVGHHTHQAFIYVNLGVIQTSVIIITQKTP